MHKHYCFLEHKLDAESYADDELLAVGPGSNAASDVMERSTATVSNKGTYTHAYYVTSQISYMLDNVRS